MKKFIFILLAIIFLAGGIVIFWGIKNNMSFVGKITNPLAPDVSTGVNQEDVVITYTDSGFLPSVVNVRKNGTVIFKNESGKPMLIASAPHPTHTDYPEMSAKDIVNKGGSYSFTFTKAGKWGFHNHLSPNETGTVVVN